MDKKLDGSHGCCPFACDSSIHIAIGPGSPNDAAINTLANRHRGNTPI